MKSIKKYFIYCLFLILILCGSIWICKEFLYDPVPPEDRYTKEYFFDKSIENDKSFFKGMFGKMHATSIFSFYKEKILIDVPFKKQENRLTCEVAALRMVLNHLGHSVTESDLLKKLVFSTHKTREGNTWGDPHEGFVGNINGGVSAGTGYGVYAGPINELAQNFASSSVMENANLEKVLSEVSDGNPVIVWGIISSRTPIYWLTEEEKLVIAYRGEHARVVIGHTGNIKNPEEIILMDPLYGKVFIPKDQFLDDWALLWNMAVVIYS